MSSSNTSSQQVHPMLVSIAALLLGFLGGIIAVRLGPDITPASVQRQVIESEGEVIADIVEEVSPSVVSIDVTSSVSSFNPFTGQTFRNVDSAGTGIIINQSGLIVTNKHVIPESATSVSVELSDGTVYEDVDVVGRDPFNDLAYLQIEGAENLSPATLADSDEVRVGQKVIAIGNALGQFDTTVTSGIISGVGRPIVAGTGSDAESLIGLFQTDTSINPGNSGGPLLNLSGEVVGITTAVAGNAENIGFAIPINDVKPGIASVERNGELIRPYLGVEYVMLSEEIAKELDIEQTDGAYVNSVVDGSPADDAGLRKGDVLTAINGEAITQDTPLPSIVGGLQVDEEVTLSVQRGNDTLEITVTLKRAPENL